MPISKGPSKKIVLGICFIFIIFLISGCNRVENNYYLSFTEESDAWKLKGYEVRITPDAFIAGNGLLSMKGKDEYFTDIFSFTVHAVINQEDQVIHTYAATGSEINIARKRIGRIEGKAYINKEGTPINLDNISEIYMIIDWWDKEQEKKVEERINLYD